LPLIGISSPVCVPSLLVAEGDLVGDLVGLDRPQSFAQALASLPQELE
jgi:hypothetical protein